jgi:hypothetical protein
MGASESEITLRDLFAGFALAGMVDGSHVARPDELEGWPGRCAAWSFRLADAMLAERERVLNAENPRGR